MADLSSLAVIESELADTADYDVAVDVSKAKRRVTVLSCQETDRPAKPIQLWLPGHGPGTELKAILETLGIEAGPTCDCRARANQMDLWGAQGCREHREQILAWMREGQARWGWKDKLAAAAKAVQSGLAFKLNPLDPFPSLVDEAIGRAEAKEPVHAG